MTFAGAILASFALIGVAASSGCVCILFEHWSQTRTQRKAEANSREAFLNRRKARILQIGRVVLDQYAREHTTGFVLDCESCVPAQARAPDGALLFGNWTEAELVEIAKRRKEWE